MSIQGEKLDAFAISRGSIKRAEKKMVTAAKKELNGRFSDQDMTKLTIGGAGAGLSQAEKEEWIATLKENFPNARIVYSPLSASISVHTGPGAVGISISFR